MTMKLVPLVEHLDGTARHTVETMLANPKFLTTDRNWLKSVLLAYVQNGGLTMAQHKIMDVLIGVGTTGLRLRSAEIFTPRHPAALPPAPVKRRSTAKQAAAKDALAKAEAKATKPKSKAKSRRQKP